MRKIEVLVRVSYPVTNRPGGKTDENGRYVQMVIEDGTSGVILAKLDLSAVEWTQIMACQITRVSEGAQTGDRLDRVGLTMENETRTLGYGMSDADVAAVAADALANGWDEATPGSSNRGRTVQCRRWR